jgi:hypothetical protein
MWFGTKNSAQDHQQNMDHIFEPIVCNQRMAVFIDDFILLSKTFEEHLILLQEFLDLCVKYHLKLSKKKASIAKTSILTLGLQLSRDKELFLVKANWIVFRIFQHPLPKNKSSHFLAY